VVTVKYFQEGLTSRLAGLGRVVAEPRGLGAVAGRKVQSLLKSHLIRLNASRRNDVSTRRSGFYRKAADSVTQPEISADGTTVSVSVTEPGFAQRLHGGTITPKGGKEFLTIPVSQDAYNRTVAVFKKEKPELKIFRLYPKGGGDPWALATLRGKGQKLKIEYLLRRSVTQTADPSVMPDQALIEFEVIGTVQRELDRAAKNLN
jgi:hypothetical protein